MLKKEDIDRIREESIQAPIFKPKDADDVEILLYAFRNLAESSNRLLEWAEKAARAMTRATWSCLPETKEQLETLLEEVSFSGPKKMSKSG